MPPRVKKPDTPYLDAWRDRLAAATEERGAKTDLARYMAAHRSQALNSWKVNIARLLNTPQSPGGEDLLAITAWMDGRKL